MCWLFYTMSSIHRLPFDSHRKRNRSSCFAVLPPSTAPLAFFVGLFSYCDNRIMGGSQVCVINLVPLKPTFELSLFLAEDEEVYKQNLNECLIFSNRFRKQNLFDFSKFKTIWELISRHTFTSNEGNSSETTCGNFQNWELLSNLQKGNLWSNFQICHSAYYT